MKYLKPFPMKDMSILLRDGIIATQNQSREIVEGDLYIEDGRIIEIGRSNNEADHVIDCSGKVVIPGMINTHNHVANTLLRGFADDVHLHEMLEKTFEFDAKVTRRDVQVGALLGCLEMIKSGTTTFVDLFYWEDEVARAVREAGMRAYLGWAVLDEEISTQRGTPLDNCAAFISKHRNEDLITPLVSLMGVYVCSEETLLAGKQLAEKEDVMLHMHLSETRKEVYDHQKKTSERPIEWLSKIGFLTERLLAAHIGWVTIGEVRMLAEKDVKVSHCPVSNMKLATGGVAPLPEMFENGVTVSLGTDSPVSNNSLDMFETMKFCALLHKADRWDARVFDAQKVFDLATVDGARALGMEDDIGSIEIGKRADIAVLDFASPMTTPYDKFRIVSHLVYSCNGANVTTTIVDGNIVVDQGKATGLKEEMIYDRANEIAIELFEEE
ncbi:MAG: amidohydrolase family protein [Thermoplasmata archaeon]